MKTPEQPGGTQIRVSTDPHVLVSISGPTEAAVLRRAADWLDTLDGAVLIVASNWRGDVGAPDDKDTPFYRGPDRRHEHRGPRGPVATRLVPRSGLIAGEP